jgi:hypothetical protein
MSEALALIQRLESAHAAARLEDIGSFQKLSEPLQRLAEVLREDYQASVAGPVRVIVEKLQTGETLTPQEIKLVETFIVGDAESYVRLENDFQSWTAELARLVKNLGMKSRGLDGTALLDAVGEIEDARRVLGDICYYLEQKERIARFRRTVADGINPGRAQTLVDILEQQLESPRA